MKEFIKQISLTTVIIIYLFICGGIYLIGFWSTFGIDAFSLADIWDIPKSFIYSVSFSLGVTFLLANIVYLFFKILGGKIDTPNTLKIPIIFIYICTAICIVGFFFLRQYPVYWLLATYFISVMFCYEISNITSFKNAVPSIILRRSLCIIFILCPIMSFGFGKANSLFIYQNSKIKYISIPMDTTNKIMSKDSSLKLLGFLGGKLIVSKINNESIFILNQSSLGMIKLQKGGKQFFLGK